MIINNYSKRNIYPQSGLFNYSIDITTFSAEDYVVFGFSGQNNNLSYTLQSGKCYYDNAFIGSYLPDIPLNISGNVSNIAHDVYINGLPKIFGATKPTGSINYLYFDTSDEIEVNTIIQAQTPDYYYDPLSTYFSGQHIPINVYNEGSFPFRIFSGKLLNNTGNFELSGVQNLDVNSSGLGTFYLNALTFYPNNQNLPIRLYTNFGNVDLNFNASGIDLSSYSFYLAFGPDVPIVNEQNSYTLSFRNTSGAAISVSLEYESGATGDYYESILRSKNVTGGVSGLITGSGELVSYYVGEVGQLNPLNNVYESGTGSGYLSHFQYATGDVAYQYEIKVSGLGSGLISTGLIGTGSGDFTFSGEISYAGGLLSISGITGYGYGENGSIGSYSGVIQSGIATIFVPYTGGNITHYFPPSDYESGLYLSDYLYATGTFSRFYSIQGLAYATGERVTGRLIGDFGFNFEPGRYTFNKTVAMAGYGQSQVLTGFNPTLVTHMLIDTSGLITGNLVKQMKVDACNFGEYNYDPLVGFPSTIRTTGGVLVTPVVLDLMSPSNTGEYIYENSDYILESGGSPRTNISRVGNTISGSGQFNNIFREPFFTGDWYAQDYGWRESIEGYSTTTKGSGEAPKLSSFKSSLYFGETGHSGIVRFSITGNFTGRKFISIKTSTEEFGSQGAPDSAFYLYDYTGGLILSGNRYTDYRSSFDMSLPTGDNNSYGFQPMVKVALTTGDYFLKIMMLTGKYQKEGAGTIGYVNDTFWSYEKDREAYTLIYRSSGSQGKVGSNISYTDGTANSGLDYIINHNNSFVEFPDKSLGVQLVKIPITNNVVRQPNKYFHAELVNPSGGAVLGSYLAANINIVEDEPNSCYCAAPIAQITSLEDEQTVFQNKSYLLSGSFSGGTGYNSVTETPTGFSIGKVEWYANGKLFSTNTQYPYTGGYWTSPSYSGYALIQALVYNQCYIECGSLTGNMALSTVKLRVNGGACSSNFNTGIESQGLLYYGNGGDGCEYVSTVDFAPRRHFILGFNPIYEPDRLKVYSVNKDCQETLIIDTKCISANNFPSMGGNGFNNVFMMSGTSGISGEIYQYKCPEYPNWGYSGYGDLRIAGYSLEDTQKFRLEVLGGCSYNNGCMAGDCKFNVSDTFWAAYIYDYPRSMTGNMNWSCACENCPES